MEGRTLRCLPLVAALVVLGGCASTPPAPSSSQTLTLPPVGAWQWTVIEPVAAAESFDQVAIGPTGLAATGRPSKIWLSSDGATWVSLDPPSAEATFTDLVAAPGGTFVAVGFTPDKGALFLRVKGSTSEVGDAGPGPASAAVDVVRSGQGYVAAGGSIDQHAIAYLWTSADGRTWVRQDGPADALFGALVHGPDEWLAASNLSAPELGDGTADLWSSTDARAWKRTATLPDAGISALVATSKGWIAVGRTSSGGGQHDLYATAWRSADGTNWDRVAKEREMSSLTGVVRWRDAYVAFGSTIPGPGTRRRGIVWASSDGATWSPVQGVELGDTALADGDATDERLVLVGQRGDGPVIFSATP